MSSEEGYDYSYTQFLHESDDQLSGWFDEFTLALANDRSTDSLQEHFADGHLQDESSFFDDATWSLQSGTNRDTTDDVSSTVSTMEHPFDCSVATPADLALVFGGTQRQIRDSGDPLGQETERKVLYGLEDQDQAGTLGAAQPTSSSTLQVMPANLSMLNGSENGASQKLHLNVPRARPIDVSFFLEQH